MNFVFRDAEAVKGQINHFMALHPEIAEDAEFMADVLEGETDLHKVIERALDERQEAQTMAAAIKEREADLAERRKRYERRAASMKDLIRELMLAAGQEKLVLPEATLSIAKARASVDVVELYDLPQGFFSLERKADKKAIMEAFAAGMEVPGAVLNQGDFSLTVRVK